MCISYPGKDEYAEIPILHITLNPEEYIYLERLDVNHEYQKMGIGKEILSCIEKMAKISGRRYILLFTRPRIVPLRFWRRQGFLPMDGISKFIISLLEELDDIKISVTREHVGVIDPNMHMFKNISNV